jgi:hypothetical protein
MMKPTPYSVTDLSCSCGYLARNAQDPNLPVKFDAELNEYSFEITLPGGTMISINIYHCPLCGGVASESKRDELFDVVTEEEVLRLERIINKLATVEDIESSLGPPDSDRTYHMPSDYLPVKLREAGPIRQMDFTHLSETADVQFNVYSNNEITRAIVPKYVGARHPSAGSAPKRRRRPSRSR